MDAPSLTPERSRELADLRRRAYGPDADIHRDPEALGRLTELEELARVEPAVEEEPPAAPPAGDAALVDPTVEAGPGDESPPGDEPAPPARWWRRIPLWGSILAAAAVGLAVGAVVAVVGMSLTPRADASLEPLTGPEREVDGSLVRGFMDWLDIDDPMTEHESFGRFRVLTGTSEFGSSCLVVVWENIWADGSCAPGELVPLVDFIAYRGAAQPLEQDLLPGSVIRFELRDGVVDVTIHAAGGE